MSTTETSPSPTETPPPSGEAAVAKLLEKIVGQHQWSATQTPEVAALLDEVRTWGEGEETAPPAEEDTEAEPTPPEVEPTPPEVEPTT